MKREELIAMGISEENADKIMADYGSTVQKANAKAEQYKEKANKADELQTQLDELNSQNMTELEKATTALETANQKIAELEKKDTVRTQRANAMEKFGLTAEQASKVVTDDGATDYEVLGQIFADSKKTAIAEYEKQKLDDTPNPGGSTGGNNGDDKPEDVKNAESISFGNVSAEQSTKDYYKI
jgi:hypothetical protein